MQSVKEIKLQLTPSPLYTLFQGGGCPENVTCDLGGRILHLLGGRSPPDFHDLNKCNLHISWYYPPKKMQVTFSDAPLHFQGGRGSDTVWHM